VKLKQKMRMLMIAPQPFFTPRGTPFSVYYRARELAVMGVEIDLVTYPIGKDVRIPGVTIHRTASFPFINRVRVGPSFTKLLLDILLFWKAFWMLVRRRYTLVHVHEEAGFFYLAYQPFTKTKLIYDMHSSLPEQLANFRFGGARFLAGTFRFLERAVIRRADLVITICPELQNKVLTEHPGVHSILIENTLCDPIAFTNTTDELDEDLIRWERFDDRKVVFYSGTFEPYQGIPLLVRSIPEVSRHCPHVLYILIGGSRKQVNAMRRLADDLGVRPFVIFTGTLQPNTVKKIMRRADILVSPRSRGTNSPLKIYEYLASGKPIVATRLATHTQVLKGTEAVLTEPTASAFAQGIRSILDDPSKEKSMGAEARSRYDKVYGPDAYTAKMQEGMNHVA